MNKNLKRLLLITTILIIITLIFEYFKVDIKFQSFFWKNDTWYLKQTEPWHFLYEYGTFPGCIIAVGSLILITISYFMTTLKKYKKIFFFLVLSLILGPGLVVNSIFKDRWGRPRPRNIEEFGGIREYHKVWERGIQGSGKSFPCGHASMGFYFITLAFLIKKKKLKIALTFFAIIFGSLIGFARIVQGGHFLSDVIWSAYLVYLTAFILFYALKLNKNLFYKEKRKTKFRLIKVIMLILVIGLFVQIFYFSMPFYKFKTYKVEQSKLKNLKTVIFNIDKTDFQIIESDSLYVKYEVQGFGLPGTKGKFKSKLANDTLKIKSYIKGNPSEINSNYRIHLPLKSNIDFNIFYSNIDTIHYEKTIKQYRNLSIIKNEKD